MKMTREYTPDNISELPEDGILVFGSNMEGRHGKGVALLAKQKFGAIEGVRQGMMGRSFAIVTKKNWRVGRSSTLQDISAGISFFLGFAMMKKENRFYVTKIGTGLAGYTVEEIRGIFVELRDVYNIVPSSNVILPKEYEIRE